MNVKNTLLVALLGLVAALGVACAGNGGPTPTRTPRAEALNNPTQTPWIIYVPVTTTPEPFTVTPLPTVTSAAPTQPPPPPATRTRAPQPTARPVKPTATPADSPTAAPPPASPTPECGPYTVAALGPLPENGVTRNTKQNPGGNMALVFNFTPAVSYPLDTKIGYMLQVKAKANSAARYMSHNGFLASHQMVLDQYAVYNLTLPGGDDTTVNWTITPVMSTGGFNDSTFQALGTVTTCGPTTGPWSIFLKVQ